jgi:hypothetical protein
VSTKPGAGHIVFSRAVFGESSNSRRKEASVGSLPESRLSFWLGGSINRSGYLHVSSGSHLSRSLQGTSKKCILSVRIESDELVAVQAIHLRAIAYTAALFFENARARWTSYFDLVFHRKVSLKISYQSASSRSL